MKLTTSREKPEHGRTGDKQLDEWAAPRFAGPTPAAGRPPPTRVHLELPFPRASCLRVFVVVVFSRQPVQKHSDVRQ
jgi:hypothetical protein